MNVRALVDRGIELRAEIKKLQKELDGIEVALESAGYEGTHRELKDEDREGRRWMAAGSRLIIPVVFTADKIVSSFKKDSPQHTRAAAAAAGKLGEFYLPATTFENRFKDGKQFRKAADETLGQAAPGFITVCLARDKHGVPKSDVKIAWEDAEPVK